ncbi:MAG: TraX family protein [Anaerocolumna sp.]
MKYIGIHFIWQAVSIAINIVSFKIPWLSDDFCVNILPAIFGNVFYVEGGLVFVLLGVLFYLTKGNKKVFALSYTLFCMLYFLATATSILPIVIGKMEYYDLRPLKNIANYTLDVIIRISPMSVGGSYLYQNYQWMMIGALPFMLTYNKKSGKRLKYLFYVFYPLHIIILYYLGKLL